MLSSSTSQQETCRSILQISASEVKVSSFKSLSSKKEDGFQASLSYRTTHCGLMDDILRV